MTKNIILITLFILFAGALIAGGIYRTSAKSGYAISLGGEDIVEITQNPDNHTPRALGAQDGQQNGERAGPGQGEPGNSAESGGAHGRALRRANATLAAPGPLRRLVGGPAIPGRSVPRREDAR